VRFGGHAPILPIPGPARHRNTGSRAASARRSAVTGYLEFFAQAYRLARRRVTGTLATLQASVLTRSAS
jgi:hypothetical protein